MPTYNPAVTPTWVFTANTSATATVQFVNIGRYPVYVGGSQVTQNTGLPVPPGGKPVKLIGVTGNLYALSGVVASSAAGTMSSSAVAAGSTAITLTTAVPAGLAAGTTIIVGYSTASTASWEAQVVASTTASSQITFANPLVQDHAGSGVIYTASMAPAQVRVERGML